MAIRTKLLRAILIFSSWLWTESRANWNPLPRFQTFPVCGSYTYRLRRKVYELALYLSQENILRTYAKTLYIAHENFDELHALSRALAELCGTQSPNYFYSKNQ